MSDGRDHGRTAEWLAEHPRMIGAVFTMLLLVSQAGNAAASGSSSIVGP
ncbi:MAG: hypothetical protein V5A23_07900 [Halobacteriales archaeon]